MVAKSRLLVEMEDEKMLPFVRRFGASELKVGNFLQKEELLHQKNIK